MIGDAVLLLNMRKARKTTVKVKNSYNTSNRPVIMLNNQNINLLYELRLI